MTKAAAARQFAGSDIVVRDEDGLLTAEVAGELVGMSVGQGTCYGFNGVATRIWALLAEPRSVDSLCDQLQAEFEVDEQRCRTDVSELLEELRAEGLVKAADAE
jgi:hypothetical protein